MSRTTIVKEGGTIRYRNKDAGLVLRLGIVAFAVVAALPFFAFYVRGWREQDWAVGPTPLAFVVVTLVFVVLPLAVGAMFLWFALFTDDVDLILDPSAGEARLHTRRPFRERHRRFALATMPAPYARFEFDDPSREEPQIVLPLPEGDRVVITGLYNDDDARFWLWQIRVALGQTNGSSA